MAKGEGPTRCRTSPPPCELVWEDDRTVQVPDVGRVVVGALVNINCQRQTHISELATLLGYAKKVQI